MCVQKTGYTILGAGPTIIFEVLLFNHAWYDMHAALGWCIGACLCWLPPQLLLWPGTRYGTKASRSGRLSNARTHRHSCGFSLSKTFRVHSGSRLSFMVTVAVAAVLGFIGSTTLAITIFRTKSLVKIRSMRLIGYDSIGDIIFALCEEILSGAPRLAAISLHSPLFAACLLNCLHVPIKCWFECSLHSSLHKDMGSWWIQR
jgi:hypothetical protein